jgi:hypothetical protein
VPGPALRRKSAGAVVSRSDLDIILAGVPSAEGARDGRRHVAQGRAWLGRAFGVRRLLPLALAAATSFSSRSACTSIRFSSYAAASLALTRITVSADHGAPVGVATLRAFSSAAALFADSAASLVNTGRRASARSAAALLLASD